MGAEVRLERAKGKNDTLRFIMVTRPTPVGWTFRKHGDPNSAASHRGADMHGNLPVDTLCMVTKDSDK